MVVGILSHMGFNKEYQLNYFILAIFLGEERTNTFLRWNTIQYPIKINLQKTDALEKQIPPLNLMNILNLMTINLASRHLHLSIAIFFFPIRLPSSKGWVKSHTMIKWQLRWMWHRISRFNQYKFEVTNQIQISDKLQIILSCTSQILYCSISWY